jgi:hypothetical protein
MRVNAKSKTIRCGSGRRNILNTVWAHTNEADIIFPYRYGLVERHIVTGRTTSRVCLERDFYRTGLNAFNSYGTPTIFQYSSWANRKSIFKTSYLIKTER